MVLQLLFGFIGLIVGALILNDGGWLFGALLGFLITKVVQMGQQIKDQTKEISLLKSMQEYLHLTLRNLQTSTESIKEDTKPIEITSAETLPTHTHTEVQSQTVASKMTPEMSKATGDIPEPAITQIPKITAAPKPANPKQPTTDLADKIGNRIRQFFIGGNPVVRIGMLVLFFGLSFLVKYAAGQGYFPIELRLSCVALIAIVLIILGWKTRAKEGGYGLVLQGGGLAALYLTSFAAAKMYDLIPASAAMVLLFILVIFGVMFALLQNAQVLAIMAIAGGFLAPILTSDGSGNHVGLFSVYLILNLGIFAISWFKSWRLLNWIGFVFTFVISVFWGVSRYEPQFYSSTQPFLIAFFFLYLVISILFSLKQPPNLKGLVDGSLVFGLPVAAFSLQVALLKHTEYGLAISALVLAIIYMALSRWLWMKFLRTHQLLAESFLALGVGFATLAIPLGLDSDWTSATWAFEAAGLLWVGLRQQRLLPRIAGVSLYFAACLATISDNGLVAGTTPIITGDFISGVILSLSGFLIAYCFFCFAQVAHLVERWFGKIILVIAVIWWIAIVLVELMAHQIDKDMFITVYFIMALSLIVQLWSALKLNWPGLAKAGHIYFGFIVLWTLLGFIARSTDFPTDRLLGLPFILFLSAQYYFIWHLEKSQWTTGLQLVHFSASLLVLLLLLWQADGVANHTDFLRSVMSPETAVLFIWFIVFAPAVILLIQLNSRRYWPIPSWKTQYQDIIPVPFILIILGWFFIAARESGSILEFYLPIVNPIDITQFAAVLLIAYALKSGLSLSHHWSNTIKAGLIALLVFIWINIVMLRAIHHYTLIQYDSATLWQSPSVQMALSILWSICALIVMNIARRIHQRQLWIVGAGLLLLVVIKLFTRDLSGSGTIARIVSFMGVGGLMLLIGYLSPIPPVKQAITADKKLEESSQ